VMSHAAFTVSPRDSASQASEPAPRQATAIHIAADRAFFMSGILRVAPAADKSWRAARRRGAARIVSFKVSFSHPNPGLS